MARHASLNLSLIGPLHQRLAEAGRLCSPLCPASHTHWHDISPLFLLSAVSAGSVARPDRIIGDGTDTSTWPDTISAFAQLPDRAIRPKGSDCA